MAGCSVTCGEIRDAQIAARPVKQKNCFASRSKKRATLGIW
jgi:hypothetical protein